MHCSSRDAQICIAVAGIPRCSRDFGIGLLKGCRLRKLCAELISCFDMFTMPAKKHNKAALHITTVPKSNEAAKHVKRSLPQSSADATQRKRCKGPSIPCAKIAEAAESAIPNHADDDEQRAARNSTAKDMTLVRDGSLCWSSLLCSRCGKFLVNHRKSVRRGLCCNKCPNHGPWCTSNANLAASSLLDGCENLPPAVPSSYRRGTQSERMLIAKDLLGPGPTDTTE